jgi:LPPG:FO 2-phospho-L-lactate transferase
VREDSSRALERARSLGADAWFWLGDLDIGLHMARTEWLRSGEPLSAVTARLGDALGLGLRLLPATDDRLRTMIGVDGGEIDFQTYYVRHAHRDVVRSLRFDGAESSVPAPGVLDALAASAVVVAPSNPLISIGPILAVPGVREALENRPGRCVAVSPIVAGQAIRGPAADMLRTLGHEPSPVGVARLYEGLCDAFVLDRADAAIAPQVEALGMRAVVADTVMRDPLVRRALASETLQAAGIGV